MTSALVYREPTGAPGWAGTAVGQPFRSHLIATGEWADMQARWREADARLRATDTPGHVQVRDTADPAVPGDLSPHWVRMLVKPVPRPRPGSVHSAHGPDVGHTLTTRGYRYFATCICGYVGPVRLDPNDASNMGEDHAAKAYYLRTGRWEE